jgi:hypothetical protein
MPSTNHIKLQVQHGSLELVILDRPRPDAASFLERNQVAVRFIATRHGSDAYVVDGTLYVGDFVRFSFDLDLYVEGRWYYSGTLRSTDPAWKRDELWLPLSCGRLTIAYRGRSGGSAYHELSYTPHGQETPCWHFDLTSDELIQLHEGIDSLFSNFRVLTIPAVTPEPSAEIRQRLDAFMDELVENWYFLRLEALRSRRWGAVLCLKYWLSEDVLRTQQVVNAISHVAADHLLAYPFVDVPEVPPVARIPVSLDGLIGYLQDCPLIDNVLFTCPKGSFAILVTHEDHMIVAGPVPFLHDAFAGFYYELRLNFRHVFLSRGPAHPEESNLAILDEQDLWLTRDLEYTALIYSSE